MVMAILIEFTNDETAKAFVEKVNGQFGQMDMTEVHDRPRRQVVGIWKIPTKFCKCSSEGVKMKISGYTRGAKYGWWIHNICGRPSRFWVKARDTGLLWDGLGKNLLPGAPNEGEPEWHGPDHKDGHDNLVMNEVMPEVGAPWKSDLDNAKTERRRRRKGQRPRRGDGTVAGH